MTSVPSKHIPGGENFFNEKICVCYSIPLLLLFTNLLTCIIIGSKKPREKKEKKEKKAKEPLQPLPLASPPMAGPTNPSVSEGGSGVSGGIEPSFSGPVFPGMMAVSAPHPEPPKPSKKQEPKTSGLLTETVGPIGHFVVSMLCLPRDCHHTVADSAQSVL